MLDLWDVFSNSLWILGLAVLLAVWSYGRYAAQTSGMRVRDKLNTLKYALVVNVGLFLFLCGMALTENRLFVRVLWILLAIAVLVESGMRIKQLNKEKSDPNE